ncbi:hypothetical protein KNE206_34540 [Kitasatospora sp. NE20-6]
MIGFTPAQSGTATPGIGSPAHCVLAVFMYYKRNLQPRNKSEAGDVNISGVDFWHAVEFSRNGHFLRTAFQRTLRAFRSFVFPAYQIRARALSRLAFDFFHRNRPDGLSDVSNLSRSPLRKANPTATHINAHTEFAQGRDKTRPCPGIGK